jgi:gluconokinase
MKFFVMGVSGSGKSTVGLNASLELNCTFIEADDFHTTNNKSKMALGIVLSFH